MAKRTKQRRQPQHRPAAAMRPPVHDAARREAGAPAAHVEGATSTSGGAAVLPDPGADALDAVVVEDAVEPDDGALVTTEPPPAVSVQDTIDAPASREPDAGAARRVMTPGAPARRRVGRIDPLTARPAPRPARAGTAVATFEALPDDDDAIPFERVPYVPADLRRVAVIAAIMIVLIIVAAIIVSNVVK